MGFDTWTQFSGELTAHMERVHYHFNQLLVTEDDEATDQETRDLKELWININDPQFTAETVNLSGTKLAPLSKNSGTCQFKCVSAAERSFLVEMVVDG